MVTSSQPDRANHSTQLQQPGKDEIVPAREIIPPMERWSFQAAKDDTRVQTAPFQCFHSDGHFWLFAYAENSSYYGDPIRIDVFACGRCVAIRAS